MSAFPLKSFAGRRAAMTATELMIVISILAVVMVLALPVFNSITERARETRCAQRLRQAGMLLTSYINETNGRFETFFGGTGGELWTQQLVSRKYITMQDVPTLLRCPYGETVQPLFQGNAWYWEAYGLALYRSEYELRPIAKRTAAILYRAKVADPSQFVLLADSASMGNGKQSFRISQLNGSNTGLSLLHRRQANVFFLDGHLESVSRKRAEDLGMTGMIYPANTP